MRKIVIVCHGKLANEFVNSAEMILGKQNNLFGIEFSPSESLDDLFVKITDTFDDEDLILLADIKGGTPFNAAFKYKFLHNKADVIAGVNMPLVIEMVNHINFNGNVTLEGFKFDGLIEMI